MDAVLWITHGLHFNKLDSIECDNGCAHANIDIVGFFMQIKYITCELTFFYFLFFSFKNCLVLKCNTKQSSLIFSFFKVL